MSGATREQLMGAVADLDAALAQRPGGVAELRQLLAERDARLSEQHIRLVGLVEQVAELQARLGRDSSNSSQPP